MKPVTVVERWFGPRFAELHPALQALHRNGGSLHGPVTVDTGRGLAGFVGRRLARRLGLPCDAGPHTLRVDIAHGAGALSWSRRFDERSTMRSLFRPVGTLDGGGCWIEDTGPLRMALGVDIVEGGWHWRCRKLWVRGVRLPLWLIPAATAFKTIEGGRYRFYVGFSLPLLGRVLSYSGLLDVDSAP